MSGYREGWERATRINPDDGPLVERTKTLWEAADLIASVDLRVNPPDLGCREAGRP
jgi:hypothetical protein